MREIEYLPVGKVHLTPSQKKDEIIKRLRYWVAVLAVADVLYTVFAGIVVYMAVVR